MFFNITNAAAAVAEASGNLSRWRHQPVGIKLLFSEGDYFMPGFDRDQAAIDNTVENRRLGSVMLTVGWVLLWWEADTESCASSACATARGSGRSQWGSFVELG